MKKYSKELSLSEVKVHLENTLFWAKQAELDEHFISEIKHLISVAIANMDVKVNK